VEARPLVSSLGCDAPQMELEPIPMALPHPCAVSLRLAVSVASKVLAVYDRDFGSETRRRKRGLDGKS